MRLVVRELSCLSVTIPVPRCLQRCCSEQNLHKVRPVNLTASIRDVNITPVYIPCHPLKVSAFIGKVYAHSVPHAPIKNRWCIFVYIPH